MKPTDAAWSAMVHAVLIRAPEDVDLGAEYLARLIAQVRAEERERCARVADREAERLPFMNQVGKNAARSIAAAIREGDV